MGVFKVSNYVEAYRLRAKYSKDFHLLDGRHGSRDVTQFINQRLWDHLQITPSDTVVDVGCGDGCLLSMARDKGVSQAVGLSGTEDEAQRLRSQGLNVRQGLTTSLPILDDFASVVVCNSVLVIVPRSEIPASLREIARIARPGARIWLGEIPRVPELAGVPRHPNIASLLWYLLRKHGLRTFLGMVRRIVRSSFRGEPFILNSAPVIQFYAEPEDFIRLASDAGLKLESYFPLEELDERGNIRQSETRLDYRFTK